MANEIKDAKDGLGTRLATITGLRIHDFEPEGVIEMPVAIIRFTRRLVGDLTIGGSSFTGDITVTLLLNVPGDEQEAFDEMDKYIAPLGTESIEAAIDGDNTWNSKVDDGRLVEINTVGWRNIFGGRYMGADFVCRFIKQVTT